MKNYFMDYSLLEFKLILKIGKLKQLEIKKVINLWQFFD